MILLISAAWAWNLGDWVWLDDEVLLAVDHREDVPPGWAEAWQGAADAWSTVECADIRVSVQPPGDASGSRTDGVTGAWYDPTASEGRLVPHLTDDTLHAAGHTLLVIDEADITFSASIPYATTGAIDGGTCDDAFDLQALATHNLGHLLGLGHSCEQGSACTSEAEFEATMYWSTLPCDTHQATLNEDDAAGLRALYAPSLSVTCEGNSTVVAPPFTIACTATPHHAYGSEDVVWDLGDDTTATGLSATSTYTEPGTYAVSACVHFASDACSDTTACTNLELTVCGPPEPVLTLTFQNAHTIRVDGATDGPSACASTWAWRVLDPTGVAVDTSAEPGQLSAVLPADGIYTVELTLSGVGGEGTASVPISVVAPPPADSAPQEPAGCSTGSAPAAIFGVLLAFGLAWNRTGAPPRPEDRAGPGC